MASKPTRAIWLGDDAKLSIREIDEVYVPTGSQSLVAVQYSAINPADIWHFYMGMNSYVAGYEWIGQAVAVGPESPYKVGELLFGIALWGHQRPLHRGAHQDYLLAETLCTWRVPDDMALSGGNDGDKRESLSQVVSWPVGVLTATDMLFNVLDFAFPGVDGLEKGTDPRGRAILIWGGGSVVGASAIQLAKAAGFSPIYTTASPHNHETLRELGATHVFDYRSPTVVEEIRAAVAASGKELSVIADAVTAGTGFGEPPSPVPRDISKASVTIAKKTLSEGAFDVRLVATLIVDFDADWKFCLSIRQPTEFPDYSARSEAVAKWVWKHHQELFKIPQVRIVRGAEEGIKAIQDVFDGKVSLEKIAIEHPM